MSQSNRLSASDLACWDESVLLTGSKVREVLAVTRQSVSQWVNDGTLVPAREVRLDGRVVGRLFHAADVYQLHRQRLRRGVRRQPR